MKYETTVTGIGDLVNELRDGHILIIFNDNAPAELAELSVIHEVAELKENVMIGDEISFGGLDYTILDVGAEANHTLKTLGHCTMRFDVEKVELPGEIALSGNTVPDVKINDVITIK